MFVNHTKKYIFVRPPKTAGSSIQNHLIENSIDDDITTTQMDLEYVKDFYDRNPLKKKTVIPITFAHMKITDEPVNKMLRDSELSDYDIYGVIREPVDRFMSAVFFMMASNKLPAINNNDYLVRTVLSYNYSNWLHFLPQTTWLKLNDNPIDKIYTFENINQLAIDLTGVELSKRHKTTERNGRDNSLSTELRDKILEIYSSDLELYEHTRNKK